MCLMFGFSLGMLLGIQLSTVLPVGDIIVSVSTNKSQHEHCTVIQI